MKCDSNSTKRDRSRSSWIALAALALTALDGSSAERFPARPIEIIVLFGAGGGADLMARKLANLIIPGLGVPVTIDNVAGGSGNVGLTKLLGKPADGHTLSTLGASSVASWAGRMAARNPDEFTIVALTQESPSMLFVWAHSPYHSFQQLIDHARANPGRLRVATSGVGTPDDVALRFLAAQDYRMLNAPFAKPDERFAAAVTGRVDAIYEEPGDVGQYLQTGQLKPLVVFSSTRHDAFKDVPAIGEFGMQIADLTSFRALVVSAKTPPDRVDILAGAIDKALASRDWMAYCSQTFTCTGRYTPQEAKAYVLRFQSVVRGYLQGLPPV